jgi:uracil-DNA glycosylase
MVKFNNEWDDILKDEFQKEYYQKLRKFLISEYSSFRIFPDMNDIFNALKYVSYSDVKAVIIGQDPYHEYGQAHGLCFSVQKGVPKPPSLQNIFKELYDDLGIPPAEDGTLTKWAEQGVLLMNAVLTVREGYANSHKGKGWETFTDKVISILNEREKPVVFILWGANARSKKQLITGRQHFILEAAHPSPLSAYNGFFGCRHFSKTNDFLAANNIEVINWSLC